MKPVLYSYLTGLCISQIIHWHNFRIPVFGLFFVLPMLTFAKRAVEEAHAWVILHSDTKGD